MTDVMLTPALIDGEFRILDTDLAKRLGFERPRTIRTLITRWKDELERLGICCAVQQNHEGGRGRPAMAYYLNRKQAIFITAKSETPEATDITIEIIHRFDEYEVGRASVAQQARLDPPFNTKTHDEWSMEEMRVKIAEVKLYTSTMTPSAGAWMLERLGFPIPPVELLPDWMRQRDMFSHVPPGSVTITVTPDRTDH